MNDTRTINVEKELKGMTLLATDSGNKMGEITDAIVHPIEGRVMGLIVRTSEGEERALAWPDVVIGRDAIMAREEAHFVEERIDHKLEAGVPALGEIVGTNVVTDAGKLLGRVSEVHVSLESPRTGYRVTESKLQRFLGGGFYIAADLAAAYSRDGVRIIVPEGAEELFLVTTIDEALGAQLHRSSSLLPHPKKDRTDRHVG
jgi:sporulation protein YlmC with PRC-barrel domain